MYWTLELASYLEDAPWPASKDELVDFALRTGAPLEVVENLQEIEDEGELYDTIEDIWPDYPTKEDFFLQRGRILTSSTLLHLFYKKWGRLKPYFCVPVCNGPHLVTLLFSFHENESTCLVPLIRR